MAVQHQTLKTTIFDMKATLFKGAAFTAAIALGGACICPAQVIISPPNYTVTTPANQYKFNLNGVDSGKTAQFANVDDSVDFSLNAGATYIFSMSTATIHPVDICTA